VAHLLTCADAAAQDAEQQLVTGDVLAKGGLSPASGLAAPSWAGAEDGYLLLVEVGEGRYPHSQGGRRELEPAGFHPSKRNDDSVGAGHRSNHKDRLSVDNLSREGIKAAPCLAEGGGRERKRGQRAAVPGKEGFVAASPQLGQCRGGLEAPCPST